MPIELVCVCLCVCWGGGGWNPKRSCPCPHTLVWVSAWMWGFVKPFGPHEGVETRYTSAVHLPFTMFVCFLGLLLFSRQVLFRKSVSSALLVIFVIYDVEPKMFSNSASQFLRFHDCVDNVALLTTVFLLFYFYLFIYFLLPYVLISIFSKFSIRAKQ